jgi:hypothetical protein
MPKLNVKQLKAYIAEAMDDLDPMDLDKKAKDVEKVSKKDDLIVLYSDMYKELYNIRPRWLRSEDVSEEQLREMIAHLEEIYPREMEQRKREAEEEERYFEKLSKKFEDEDKREKEAKEDLKDLGYEDLENLPKRSGMGRRLDESLKTIVREAYEAACMECGYEEDLYESEDESLEEYLSEKKSMRLGQGGRFKKLVDKLKDQGKSEESAKAIAASIGRKKYGKAKMAHWSKAGKKRASKE